MILLPAISCVLRIMIPTLYGSCGCVNREEQVRECAARVVQLRASAQRGSRAARTERRTGFNRGFAAYFVSGKNGGGCSWG